ncbi:MAG TPA: prolipoprotein diacylglyceryl transferase [Ohtaekwangia sp.]
MTLFIHWDISPELIDLGFLSVRWYSLFFLAGFLLSYHILKYSFQRNNVAPHVLDRLTVYVVVATVVGARLGHCLFYDFDYYGQHPLEIFLPVQFEPEFKFTGYQGLASHGGAIGIVIAVFLFTRKYRVNIWWLLDQLALVVPLAGCCIRLGNLMNSEMIGKPTDLPWAFVFEREDMQPRHPGQLYEAILYLLIFMLMLVLHRRTHKQYGFIFGVFLSLLFIARFAVEFVKEPQSGFESGMTFNMGQLLSLPFIIMGIVLAIANYRNRLMKA